VLKRALSDPDSEVRRLAVLAIAKVVDPQTSDLLLSALQDTDPEVQKAAVAALKQFSDPRMVQALLPLLRNQQAGIRSRALHLLESLNWHPEQPADEMWWHISKGQYYKAAVFADLAVEPLEMVFNNGPSSASVGALEALSQIDDPRANRVLAQGLKSRDSSVCVAAIEAVRKVGGPQSVELILPLLSHANGHVRTAAVDTLGRLSDHPLEELRRMIKDPQWDVRRAVADALGRLRDQKAIDVLARALSDGDSDVRESAARALGNVRSRDGIVPLIMALKDTNSSVRRMAATALSRVDPEWSSSPEARVAANQLKPFLADRDPDVRHLVTQLLASIGAMEAHARVAIVPDPYMELSQNKRNKFAVGLLMVVLCDADRDLRQAAAEALGRLGDTRAIVPLNRAINDSDDGVRNAAGFALRQLGHR